MRIVVLAGGLSTERDVSLVSGKKVYDALKSKGHEVLLLDVFLGYKGDVRSAFAENTEPEGFNISDKAPDLEAVKAMREDGGKTFFGPHVLELCGMADIVFMALHGDSGENGKIQATLDLFGIKYTGTGYLSSALAMNKYVSKLLFEKNGIPTPAYRFLESRDTDYVPDFPAFVKICSGGSSVGVYRVDDEASYRKALDEAFSYEGNVLVEKAIIGREFSDGVIDGKALPVIELAPKVGFYDYKNKYQEGSTVETCPAELPEEISKKIREYAEKAVKVLGITAYARMDFMLDKGMNIYCLEANTLPGMTPMSLMPQEAAAVGMSFADFCEKIIEVSLKK
ncbi:MAG: D-alanine--D-alanine ligase [Lachnospiraceae bacterium]|nr:D-alanine--D-alanine ligase [Lachnospiraceae bacterium]